MVVSSAAGVGVLGRNGLTDKMAETTCKGKLSLLLAGPYSKCRLSANMHDLPVLFVYVFLISVLQDARCVWLSVENMNGRWCCFSAENTKLLETAYQEGESSVR